MKLNAITCASFVILAFVAAGFVQTFWLRSELSKRFRSPIDGGRVFRKRRIFGDNKTWRGFIAIVPAVALAFVVFRVLFAILPGNLLDGLWPLSIVQYAALGCLVGVGFMLGELPNSFVKRQFDIPPGERPIRPVARRIGFLVDRFDSVIGGILLLPVPIATCLYILLLGPVIHLAFNVLLYRLGVKNRPS
jgi:CDP-2,3-bis-(O-geranylgeranyl)-sn-glycerol synthase